MKKNIIAFISLLTFTVTATPLNLRAETFNKIDPKTKAIRITPPAPKFADAERQAELARRRAEVAKNMSPNSVLILWSAEPRNYAGDVDFYYRQENNLYYLTNLKQNHATLVISKMGDNVQEYLFLPKRNPQFETWNGKMYSNEDATRISGVRNIYDAAELQTFLQSVKEKKSFSAKDGAGINLSAETVYLLLPFTERDSDGNAEFRRESEFSKLLTGYKIENARPIIDALRLVKSPYEIKLMQHAIDITTEAQMRSMAMVGRAKMEYEVQAEVEYTFRRRNADYWGYPSIVGCGPNATTLHYVESQGEVKSGDLLLMDVGAEYDHYTADVTRTFPVNGKFTKEQADIYRVVYEAQEAVAKVVKPGAKMMDVEIASAKAIEEGLARLGLITAVGAIIPGTESIQRGSRRGGVTNGVPQYTLWFMHGNSHWLGMNVHDVGSYSTAFKPGMIFTNEPGVYLREDALEYLPKKPETQAFVEKIRPVFEKYKNIGVRIEDDMLVTETGVEWMTKALPRKLEDVEAFMARASKEMNYSRLEREINPAPAFSGYGFYPAENQFGLLDFAKMPSGKTVRRGWIWSGKNTTLSGLSHIEHPHAE